MTLIANRIFEMRLYNFYLSDARMQELDIHKASLEDRSQFMAQTSSSRLVKRRP